MKPGFVWSFFFATYIFKGTSFLFQISTDSTLWEDAGTHFANVTFFFFFKFLLEACVMLVAAAFFPFMRFPMFRPEKYFIYASQVTLRPQNHLMINRLSLGAYLIDIL